jgi:hypothetical protein
VTVLDHPMLRVASGRLNDDVTLSDGVYTVPMTSLSSAGEWARMAKSTNDVIGSVCDAVDPAPAGIHPDNSENQADLPRSDWGSCNRLMPRTPASEQTLMTPGPLCASERPNR